MPGFADEVGQKTDTLQIHGKVVLPSGQPAVAAVVWHPTRVFGRDVVQAKTDAEGRYSLLITPGSRNLLLVESSDGSLAGFAQLPGPPPEGDVKTQPVDDVALKAWKQIEVQAVDNVNQPVNGASVILQSNYSIVQRAATDATGNATVKFPDGLPLQAIGAVKAEFGCDYRLFEARDFAYDPESTSPLPANFSGRLQLVLNGVQKATVTVLDPSGNPLEGVALDPWLINKPGHGNNWNLPSVQEFRRETNSDGVAVFDMLPSDQVHSIQIWPRLTRTDWFALGNGSHSDDRAHIQWEQGNSATIRYMERIPVGGDVMDSSGKPVAGITIRAAAGFKYTDWLRQTTTTDENGRWDMLVKPNGYYLFVVQDQQFCAEPQQGVLIREANAPTDLDFQLQPVRRIFGKVSGVVDSGTRIMLQQRAPDYYKLPEADRLPNPTNSDIAVSAFTQDSVAVADDGTYEFKVGPGEFTIWSPDQKTKKFTIAGELEKEFNFAMKRPVRGPVAVTVVKGDREIPVPRVMIAGRGVTEDRGFLRGETGSDGVLSTTRRLVKMIVLARSEDLELAGIDYLQPDDKQLLLKVQRAGTAVGRLVDSKGSAIANAKLEYGINMSFSDGTSSNLTTSKVTTNDNGEFELAGLCVGHKHQISRVLKEDADGAPHSWQPVIEVMVEKLNTDLGEIVSRRD